MKRKTSIAMAFAASMAGLAAGAYTENQMWAVLGLAVLLCLTLFVGEHQHERTRY